MDKGILFYISNQHKINKLAHSISHFTIAPKLEQNTLKWNIALDKRELNVEVKSDKNYSTASTNARDKSYQKPQCLKMVS